MGRECNGRKEIEREEMGKRIEIIEDKGREEKKRVHISQGQSVHQSQPQSPSIPTPLTTTSTSTHFQSN